jgi:hypothetical protein
MNAWRPQDLRILMYLLEISDWFPSLVARQLTPSILILATDHDILKLKDSSGKPMRFGQARMLMLTIRLLSEGRGLPSILLDKFNQLSVASLSKNFFQSRLSAYDPEHWDVPDVKKTLISMNMHRIAVVCEMEKVNGLVFMSCAAERDLTRLGAVNIIEREKLERFIFSLNNPNKRVRADKTTALLPAISSTSLFPPEPPPIPQDYLCPITQEIMEDPVIASDGHTYERKAISEWLDQNEVSPMTNEALESSQLFANISMKRMIREWKETPKM